MEDHVVPFLKKWKVGFGFLGEQGAESIHAGFNSIRRNYSNMPNSVARLEAVMKEHLSQVCPTNIAKLPAPKPSKKKEPCSYLVYYPIRMYHNYSSFFFIYHSYKKNISY